MSLGVMVLSFCPKESSCGGFQAPRLEWWPGSVVFLVVSGALSCALDFGSDTAGTRHTGWGRRHTSRLDQHAAHRAVVVEPVCRCGRVVSFVLHAQIERPQYAGNKEYVFQLLKRATTECGNQGFESFVCGFLALERFRAIHQALFSYLIESYVLRSYITADNVGGAISQC